MVYGRRPWIDRAITEFRRRGGKIIVEIGSIRTKGNVRGDGYSTVAWMLTGARVYSVDIDPAATALTIQETARLGARFGAVHAVTADGIEFLSNFNSEVGAIDLLYLDAWDVGTHAYKQRHLEAFQAALPHLSGVALVLVDDMDMDGLGKGELIIPAAHSAGFRVVFLEKQLLLAR